MIIAAIVSALLMALIVVLLVRHRRKQARLRAKPLSAAELSPPSPDEPSSEIRPWPVLPPAAEGRPRKGQPLALREKAERVASVNLSDSSAAPLAPGDMERVLQFVANRLDPSSGPTQDIHAAPPVYV